MRFTPEVLSMLRLRIVQLSLVMSLAFGAASTVSCTPLTSQAPQDLPTIIPNLSGYDTETRQSMELACISEKGNGPVAYGACLNRQIASLQGSPRIPNLSGYGTETRQSMELACISEKGNGPVAYGACLNRQIASLQGSPRIPNPSGYDSQNRQMATSTTSRGGTNSDRPKGGTAVYSVNSMQRFTTKNIMKIHRGMDSNKILEMFGTPKNVSQSVCGASVGTPWTCTTWEYEETPYDRASFTFSGDSGPLILNDFNVHRK
jgi:hypothetical protein